MVLFNNNYPDMVLVLYQWNADVDFINTYHYL